MDKQQLDRHIDELRELSRRNGRRAGLDEAAGVLDAMSKDLGNDEIARTMARALRLIAQGIRERATDGAPCQN